MKAERLNIVVGIATLGRREVLTETVDLLAQQTRLPDCLVICPVSDRDFDAACLQRFPRKTAVVGEAIGSSAQRNRIMDALADADIIVFFDDDFFPCPDYLAHVEKIFLAHADVTAVTGRPIEDGVNGPGLGVDRAKSIVMRAVQCPPDGGALTDTVGTYGCNMSFRMGPIRDHGVRFDENLPLYGWQEDIDFSSRLAAYGRIVESKSLKGAHLGAKGARSSGVRFGYSQIANPVYLIRKGTMSRTYAASLMWRNVAANIVRSVRPEPWIDRRGRLKGNALALFDVVTGRASPDKILQL
jgi:GT2 family glycosyltransferase